MRSWRAGQVEGNHIDTHKRRRMLETHMLREAEKPSGDVGVVKQWQILLRSSYWFFNLFILFLWQFDEHVYTVEKVVYLCAYHGGSGLWRRGNVIDTQPTIGDDVIVSTLHIVLLMVIKWLFPSFLPWYVMIFWVVTSFSRYPCLPLMTCLSLGMLGPIC